MLRTSQFFGLFSFLVLAACGGPGEPQSTHEDNSAISAFTDCDPIFNLIQGSSNLGSVQFVLSTPTRVLSARDSGFLFKQGSSTFDWSGDVSVNVTNLRLNQPGVANQSVVTAAVTFERPFNFAVVNGHPVSFRGAPNLTIVFSGITFSAVPDTCTLSADGLAGKVVATDASGTTVVAWFANTFLPG